MVSSPILGLYKGQEENLPVPSRAQCSSACDRISLEPQPKSSSLQWNFTTCHPSRHMQATEWSDETPSFVGLAKCLTLKPLRSLDFKRVVVLIRVPFCPYFFCGTYYLGYPKGDPNFDNHPYLPHSIKSPLHALCGGGLDDNPVLIWIYLPPRTRIALETR